MPKHALNTGLIYTNSNCIGCNKCISGCIAAGANVVIQEAHSDSYTVAVDPNKCVLCGHCIAECLHHARTYRDDTDAFFDALEHGENISLLIAPSLLSDYEKQYHHILGYLKHLGVCHIYNTSFGADIMVWGYINLIQHFGLKGVISQFCPVIVNYMEKYKPELLEFLMPMQSPMMCTAIYVSDYLKITDQLAYISPCIASKHEIEDVNTYGKVTYNVTFDRLMERLSKITLSGYYAEDEVAYGLGGIISMSGGLSANMELYTGFDEVLIQTTGPGNIFPYFDHYYTEVTTNGELPFLVDALNCTNGCNFGTGTSCGVEQHNEMAFSAHRAKENAYSSGIVPTGSNYSERIAKLNRLFETFELSSFVRQYDLTRKIKIPSLSEEEIADIFHSMYKDSDAKCHTDCGSCGYKTCNDMAHAIGMGINHKENCITYSKERIRRETEKTRHLLEEISAMNEELKNATQLKSNFLANMSHEIRTPMNAVIGMAEMALRGELPDEERNYISQIKASGRSLLAIINDVLDFSKIESGRMEINETEYEVMSVINDTINIVLARIGEKDISLVVNADPLIPCKLYGDDIRIKQILVNFANNAVKFTESGFVEISMQQERSEEGIFLSLAIKDTGIGIKQEDMDSIFTSFQQVDSTRNRNIEGTGLGLAIAREFVRLMGGTIHVDSTYGKGSTFSARIPQRVVDEAPSVVLKRTEQILIASCIQNLYVRNSFEQSLASFHLEHITCSSLHDIEGIVEGGAEFVFIDYPLWNEQIKMYAKNLTSAQFIVIVDPGKDIITEPYVRKLNQPVYSLSIAAVLNREHDKSFHDTFSTEGYRYEAPDADVLIVDDNAINLTVAKGLLSPLHMNVTCAASAREAIGLVEEKRYDIILMDHMMPEIDGVEATHLIREKEGEYFKNLPIIALTANAINNAREMFLREGMNDFIAKPIEIGDMLVKLKKWLPPGKIKPLGIGKSTLAPKAEVDFPIIAGLDGKVGLTYAGTQEFYRKILSDYYASIEKKANLIERLEAEGNIHDYTIEVHALKNASRLIGAGALADLAAELETCGHNNDPTPIKEKTPNLLFLYRSFLPLLAPYYETNAIEAILDITPNRLSEKLAKLYESLDNFDIDTARDIVNELQSFRFAKAEKEILDKLRVTVKELDYEESLDLAEEWNTLLSGRTML